MDAVSLVALIISVIALIGAILQLLQQYYSSAAGYANCGPRVMGPWAATRRRKFRWAELRFEVQFEAPVLFVCPPTNRRGPVRHQPLWFVKGTRKSEEQTRVPSVETEKAAADQKEEDQLQKKRHRNRDVHTADNERANWFILLQAFHKMERESHAWAQASSKQEAGALGPKLAGDLPGGIAPSARGHSTVLALQPSRRSWDAMPAGIRRPYATSTICHVVEMAALLGLHWRTFDRAAHRYHAEGNGYLLTGREVVGLGGTLFRFQVYGKNRFARSRVVPSDDVKRLCFGHVPTIFGGDAAKAGYDNEDDGDDPKSAGIVQLGSTGELIESLAHFGCNSKTTNYFRDDSKYRLGHLFPIAFELVGMVATSMYIPQTYYRFLPNPTTFSWNRKAFSLRKLVLEFGEFVRNDDFITVRTSHLSELSHQWCDDLRRHLAGWKNEDVFPMKLLQALHETVEKCDEYLVRNEKLAKLVIREHVHEVMRLLNEGAASSSSSHTSSSPGSPSRDESGEANPSSTDKTRRVFDELNSAGPEERQHKLMEIYFSKVLPAVSRKCHSALLKQKDTNIVQTPGNRSEISLSTAGKEAQAVVRARARANSGDSDDEKSVTLEHEVVTEEVWCTLVLRMFCWLLLHDFDKKDVQIPKSELFDSRLPVYIA